MKTSTFLQSWDSVKSRVHDISGCDDPQNWLFKCTNGIFYPAEKVKLPDPVLDAMFDALDPDASDEEIEALGYTIKYKKDYGSEIETFDIREGCGHAVLN